MVRQTVRVLLFILALTAGVAGIVTLTFRMRALDASTYKRSLAPSGIYRELRLTMEDSFVAATAGEQAIGTPFADALVAQMDLPGVTVIMMETNVDRLLAWVNKQSTELRMYVPFSELEAEIAGLDVSSFTFSEVEQLTASLADCTPELNEVNAVFPVCRDSDEVHSIDMQAKLESFISMLQDDSRLTSVTVLKDYFNNESLSEDMLFVQHLGAHPAEVRLPIDASLQAAQDIAQTSSLIGWGLLGIAGVLLILVVMLGEMSWRGVLSVIGLAGMLSGVLVVVLGVIGMSSPDTLLEATVPGLFLTQYYSADMLESFRLFSNRLFTLLFEMTLYTGGATAVISLLVFITAKLLPKTAAERRMSESIGTGLPEADIAPKLVPGKTKFFRP
ncbi:MAG: hypothetical protein TR69_WS6001001524 [candidate division WS6 bacterium OLB20]|uniref:Uncharacterized protein n=1 Tax=candidate division WS6 bacterium OLB20 TaxID=1617426 RepID=A0A136LVN8_9BACT|nr:MAG: hypothetical protein TR69_WS6001001524 [candidate division WS6 bacterium OLB20]